MDGYVRSDVTAAKLAVSRESLTAAAEPPFEIPLVSNPEVSNYLVNAQNRLVGLGDDVWGHCRDALLEGESSGVGVRDLRTMINDAAGVGAPRAGVIARTEINRAMNAGSITQMRQIKTPNMTKKWIAIDDPLRTRAAHLEANGQIVGINDQFLVGGERLDAPGDGSPENCINCRCTMGFDVPDDDLLNAASPTEPTTAPAQSITYADATDTQAVAQGEAERWFTQHPSHAAYAWVDYQHVGGYQTINGYLRGDPRYQTPAARQLAADMISAFDKAGMDTIQPLTFYRGLLGTDQTNWDNLLAIGKVLTDDGITSVTANSKIAPHWLVDFADFNTVPTGSAVLEIHVPAGQRILGGGTRTFETMLPPGIRFKVISVESRYLKNSIGELQGTYRYAVVEVQP